MSTVRRIALMLLALMMGAAMIARAEQPAGIPAEYVIPENAVVQLDLDGDGAAEAVSWKSVQKDEYWEDYVVTVAPKGGEPVEYALEGGYLLGVYAADLDGDGRDELLLTGDEASDDYITICLHLFNGRLEPAMFADCARTAYNRGYDKYGYGKITAIDGNRLTLCGSQDVLGTWFGSRVFTLADTGIFEFADNGKWARDIGALDADAWEYASLKTAAPLPYTAPDGGEAELLAGTRIIITASDKQTADFIAEDGTAGALDIYPNARGWGSMIGGQPEEYYFETLPYAD